MANTSDETVMNGLLGRLIVGWNMQDDGMHFELDDGRSIVLTGVFCLAVFTPTEKNIH